MHTSNEQAVTGQSGEGGEASKTGRMLTWPVVILIALLSAVIGGGVATAATLAFGKIGPVGQQGSPGPRGPQGRPATFSKLAGTGLVVSDQAYCAQGYDEEIDVPLVGGTVGDLRSIELYVCH